MGGRNERDLSNDDQVDIDAINQSTKEGIVHIDTAESYANGYSEEIIARSIKENNIRREDLFIVSKVSGSNQGYDGVISACKKSLERLNTDYLDLYLLHQFPEDFSLKDTMRALVELKDKGIVKNIGVSNFNVEHLKEAQSYSNHPIVCNQVHYNLRSREAEKTGLLEYCQENDIMLVAYRPTEKSKLFETTPEIIKEICKKYNKTFAQISLNWLISQKNVVTLAKTSNMNHLKENLGAIGWSMDEEDIERLRNEFPDQIYVSDVVPLG